MPRSRTMRLLTPDKTRLPIRIFRGRFCKVIGAGDFANHMSGGHFGDQFSIMLCLFQGSPTTIVSAWYTSSSPHENNDQAQLRSTLLFAACSCSYVHAAQINKPHESHRGHAPCRSKVFSGLNNGISSSAPPPPPCGGITVLEDLSFKGSKWRFPRVGSFPHMCRND